MTQEYDRIILIEHLPNGIINDEEQLFLSAMKNEEYRALILELLYNKEGAKNV